MHLDANVIYEEFKTRCAELDLESEGRFHHQADLSVSTMPGRIREVVLCAESKENSRTMYLGRGATLEIAEQDLKQRLSNVLPSNS